MACPRCGASDYRLIAPGFVECLGLALVPDPSSLRHGPTPAPCRTRYHTTTGQPVTATGSCGCGFFAIGACPQCGTLYCGDHSWLRDGQRLCATCARTFDDRAATLKRQQDEAHLAQLRAQHAADKAGLPALVQKAFDACPELVRTFPCGYHRSLVGRLSAPRVRVIYAGTYPNRDSDDRNVRSYCADQAGSIYTVEFAYGSSYFADPVAVDDSVHSSIASVLRSLVGHEPMPRSGDWHSWCHH
jgi:hypothetical protein